MNPTAYYTIIFGGLSFFFVAMMMLFQARRIRKLEGTVAWLKSCQHSNAKRIGYLYGELEEQSETIDVVTRRQKEIPVVVRVADPPRPPPRVILYDESIESWRNSNNGQPKMDF